MQELPVSFIDGPRILATVSSDRQATDKGLHHPRAALPLPAEPDPPSTSPPPESRPFIAGCTHRSQDAFADSGLPHTTWSGATNTCLDGTQEHLRRHAASTSQPGPKPLAICASVCSHKPSLSLRMISLRSEPTCSVTSQMPLEQANEAGKVMYS
jgi:hypothetical protein